MSSAPASLLCVALSKDLHRTRRSAYRKYVDLLTSPDVQDDTKQLAALRTAAAVLGKSPADVESDVRVLAQASRLRARITASQGTRAAEAEALQRVHAHDAESAALIKQRKEEYRKLNADYRRISHTRVSAMQAVRDLNTLIASNPDLLSAEPPATPDDVG